jgi:hypothetical protein
MAASEVVTILLRPKRGRGTPSAECSDNYRANLTYNEGSAAHGNDPLLVSKDGLDFGEDELQRVKTGPTLVKMNVQVQGCFGIGIPIFSAILTKSATESAAIFRILTVAEPVLNEIFTQPLLYPVRTQIRFRSCRADA